MTGRIEQARAVIDAPVIDAATFKRAVGRAPQDDDLERANCPKAGALGHIGCGWNTRADKPAWIAGPGPR